MPSFFLYGIFGHIRAIHGAGRVGATFSPIVHTLRQYTVDTSGRTFTTDTLATTQGSSRIYVGDYVTSYLFDHHGHTRLPNVSNRWESKAEAVSSRLERPEHNAYYRKLFPVMAGISGTFDPRMYPGGHARGAAAAGCVTICVEILKCRGQNEGHYVEFT